MKDIAESLSAIETRLKTILALAEFKDSVAAARALLDLYRFQSVQSVIDNSMPLGSPEEVMESVRRLLAEAGYEVVQAVPRRQDGNTH